MLYNLYSHKSRKILTAKKINYKNHEIWKGMRTEPGF